MLNRRGKFHGRDNATKVYKTRHSEAETRLYAEDCRARQLSSPTVAGQAFAGHLRRFGVRFEPEHILYRTGGFVIIDFFDPDRGIGFEVDGRYHRKQRRYDAGKDAHAEAQGIKIHRFENDEILYHPKETLKRLSDILAGHSTKENL